MSRRWLYPLVLSAGIFGWLMLTGSQPIFSLYGENWPSALTMTLGSFVAGSTPLGGGAIAFPVFTKLLAVEASQAKLFSLFIQSVGMTCATLLFISMGIRLYWRILLWLLPGSCLGLVVGLLYLPVSGHQIKLLFSVFALLTGILMIKVHCQQTHKPMQMPGRRLLLVIGFPAGILAALVGAGADTMLFFLLVILFGHKTQKVIPTTVAYMAMCSLIGSVIVFAAGDLPISTFVHHSWLVAAPVVAIGAPLGGYAMSRANPVHLLLFINGIILLEGLSTLLFTDLNFASQTLLLALMTTACLYMALQQNRGRLAPARITKSDINELC